MIAEILTAAAPTLLTRLLDEFFAKRRNSVDVDELQDQVARLVAENHTSRSDLDEIRHTVLVLARYLALTRQDTFALSAGRLVLAEHHHGDREAVVPPVIADFGTRVERNIEKLQNNAIETFRRRGGEPEPAPVEHAPARTAHDFLDSFAEEVLDMRLGRGGAGDA